jgi:hypothetical protein
LVVPRGPKRSQDVIRQEVNGHAEKEEYHAQPKERAGTVICGKGIELTECLCLKTSKYIFRKNIYRESIYYRESACE